MHPVRQVGTNGEAPNHIHATRQNRAGVTGTPSKLLSWLAEAVDRSIGWSRLPRRWGSWSWWDCALRFANTTRTARAVARWITRPTTTRTLKTASAPG